MAWLILFVAGLTEIGWAVGLKYTQGFTRPMPTALTVVAMVASLWLLGLAVRTLPLGTAYAIWTGIGTVGHRRRWHPALQRAGHDRCASSASR